MTRLKSRYRPRSGRRAKTAFLLGGVLCACASQEGPASSGSGADLWPGGAPCAVSITFDDGDPSHLAFAVSMLDARGLRATFYLTTDWVRDWAAWRAVAERGHEIGSHTVSHPHLPALAPTEVENEMARSKEIIEAEIGRPVLSLAYPFSETSEHVRKAAARHYLAARTGLDGGDGLNPPTPRDFHRLRSIVPISRTPLLSFFDSLQQTAVTQGWLIVMGHAVGETGWWEPVPAPVYEAFLDQVAAAGAWVAPVEEVTRYVIEREAGVSPTGAPEPEGQ